MNARPAWVAETENDGGEVVMRSAADEPCGRLIRVEAYRFSDGTTEGPVVAVYPKDGAGDVVELTAAQAREIGEALVRQAALLEGAAR